LGAFVLYKKNETIDLAELRKGFEERKFSEPSAFDLGSFKLLLYKKIVVNAVNFLSQGGNSVFVTGTLVYKQKSYSESLALILEDEINSRLNHNQLIGHFTIIFFIKGKLSVIKDRANSYNVFYDKDKTILSSSFLAVANACTKKLSPDKNAITEILITGSLIGPSTVFNEIKKIEEFNCPFFEGVKIEFANANFIALKNSDYNTCINEQIKTLDGYFEATKELANSVGVDSGLTGGFDSRLLFILGTKHYKSISFHSHWRKVRSLELECAEKICEKQKEPLQVVPVLHPIDMTEEYLIDVLNEAFYFYDGQVRAHCYWTEEYNTLTYRKKVISNNGLGLHGIGGEQYRNEERMIGKWNAKNWIKYDLIYKYSGECFLNTNDKEVFYEYYTDKVSKALRIKMKGSVDHLTVKRFLNEVYIPANRATRTNAENTVMFFLSPFAEYAVAQKAYEVIPHFGLSTDFQKDMIKTLDPAIAAVESDYGYNFYDGEPFKLKLATIIKEILPKALLYKLVHKRKSSNNDSIYTQLENKFSFFKEYETYLSKLNLSLDLEYLKNKADLAPLIVSIGLVLKKFENKISYRN